MTCLLITQASPGVVMASTLPQYAAVETGASFKSPFIFTGHATANSCFHMPSLKLHQRLTKDKISVTS